jgi:cell division protein FtsL
MSTAFPSIPAIDSLLSLFFEQQLSLKSISQRMAVSFGTLIRFMYNPDIRSLIEFAVQIQDQRHSLKANDAIAETLDDLRALRGLPENPTPADKDRQRKTLDSIRRAAESLRKSTTPRSRAQQAPTKRDPRLDKPNTIFTTQLPAELEETPVPKRRIFFPGGSNDPAEMPVDPRYTLPGGLPIDKELWELLDGFRADNRKLMLTMPEIFAEHLIPPKRLAEMREQANQEIIRRLASGARIPDDLPEKLRDQLPKVPEGYIPPAKSSYELESERVAAAATAAQAAAEAAAAHATAELPNLNSEISNLNSQISEETESPSEIADLKSEVSDPNSQPSDATDSPSEISNLKSQISEETASPSEISNLKSQISDEAPTQPPSPPH